VNYWTLAAGWIISLAAFAIRRQAIAALGKFWSLHVEIRAEHQFVQSGPFRWVRHPAYFSMILELLGGGLVLQSWWSLALAYVWFFPVLSRRVRLEEEALIAKFGPAYEEYRAKVPAFLPWKGRCL
jgi:protein-S-isoprenylcysteine O-methyltransferase Ste14